MAGDRRIAEQDKPISAAERVELDQSVMAEVVDRLDVRSGPDDLLVQIRRLGWYCTLNLPAPDRATGKRALCSATIIRPDLNVNHAHHAEAEDPNMALLLAFQQAEQATDA